MRLEGIRGVKLLLTSNSKLKTRVVGRDLDNLDNFNDDDDDMDDMDIMESWT